MVNARLAGDHLYGKLLFIWLALVMSMMVSFLVGLFSYEMSLMSFLDLIESVSGDFLIYFCDTRKSGLTLHDLIQ